MRRFLLWSFLILISVVIGIILLENYRGQRAWNSYRKAEEAKGEQFTPDAFVPAPVPDDQNFARTPYFQPFLDYTIDPMDRAHPHHRPDEAAFKRNQDLVTLNASPNSRNAKRPDSPTWRLAQFVDLRPWLHYLEGETNVATLSRQEVAKKVLLSLRRYDAVLDELRSAGARPYSRFPVHYEETFQALLPHLAALKNIGQILQLRTIARLEAGQPAEALQDLQLNLRLTDCLKTERFLISQLVRAALTEMQVHCIWEGLAQHRWTEAQLTEIQAAFERRRNILEDYGPTMRMERACAIHFIEQLRTGNYHDLSPPAADENNDSLGTAYSRTRYLPGGIFSQNQLTIARIYQDHVLPVVDAAQHRVDVKGEIEAEDLAELRTFHPYRVVASMFVPSVTRGAQRFASTQTSLDLSFVACGLERHYLATGTYPKTLDVLAPKFLADIPHDIINGQPLKYHPIEGGRFVLYSVGWNQTDDQGVPGKAESRVPRYDSRKGDWVWRYEENDSVQSSK